MRKPLTLIASEQRVRLLDGPEEVASHARTYDKGCTVEAPAHLSALAAAKARAHELRGRDLLRACCDKADAFLAALAQRDVSVAHPTAQLAHLLECHGARALNAALAEALAKGAVSASSVAHMLDPRPRTPPAAPPPACRRCSPTPRASVLPASPLIPSPTTVRGSPRTPPMTTPLAERLASLGLHSTAGALDDLIARATQARWGPAQLLEHVAAEEQQERSRRGLERRMTRSRLGRFKPRADFDWAWPKKIDREAVESALRLDFMQGARNVVLIAPQGLGKTMIAQNIAHEAVRQGHSALFASS